MSTALAEVITEPTLAELAETANREHAETCRALGSAVHHAIRAGEALIAARDLVPRGRWHEWLLENFGQSLAEASRYIRIAAYKDQVLDGHAADMRTATRYVRGLPPVRGPWVSNHNRLYSDEEREEAKRLREAGATYTDIAELLGCTQTTAITWVDPDFRERQRTKNARRLREYAERQRLAKESKRQARRYEAVERAGGSTAKAYALLRQTLQALDRAHGDATDREVRVALGAATAKLHKAEDEIVRALGVS